MIGAEHQDGLCRCAKDPDTDVERCASFAGVQPMRAIDIDPMRDGKIESLAKSHARWTPPHPDAPGDTLVSVVQTHIPACINNCATDSTGTIDA